MIARAALKHLTALELVDFRPDAAGGDAFVEHMPDQPAAAVMADAGALPELSRQPWGRPTLHLIVRGAPYDHAGAHARAQQIIDALDCQPPTRWDEDGDDEVLVEGCTALSREPGPMGRDPLHRPEYSLNFVLHTHQPSSNRPA